MGGPSLPDRVAQYYYSHALFCSSHPIISISVAITCFLLCCYPLLNIPLPGSTPTKISLPFNPEILNINNDTESTCFGNHQKSDSSYNFIFGDQSTNAIKLSKLMNETSNLPYIWAKDAPLLYVQQIILKTGVWPWREELKMGDAFRAPLQEVFRVLDLIRNHQLPKTGTTLGHICFHVENVKRNTATHKASPILPEYSCLVLSPANLWQQNLEKFSLDTNIIATVFNHQNLQKGKVSMADMVFGMQMKDTGIKRYPLRARTRTIQYAITLVFNQLHEGYIESLKEKILSIYPTQQKLDQSQNSMEITLIYYPGEFNYYEFVPLCLSFFGLFLYIYFSVRKIEFVKSKVGLAISAVVSVAASLVMSIGICFFFGLTLSFQGKEIFPYLVILVGLENVFVLTKSVMSIDSKLDVKIRLAQGLSKEGWSITKNLLTELTILTISLFTFVAVIQQFSIFMIVSLLADFLLQMFFFVTVLGIDIKRKELSRDQPTSFEFYVGPGKFIHHDFNAYQKKNSKPFDLLSKNSQTPCMYRSKSHPKLNGLVNNTYTDVIVNNFQNSTADNSKKTETKVPKRIRLVNVWARTRFFQRAFMIWMVVWISMILYSSGVVETLFLSGNMGNQNEFSKTPHTPSNDFTKSDETKAETSVNNKERKDNLFENKLKETSNLSNSINGSFFNYTPFSATSNPLVNSVMENMDFNSEILNKTLQFFSLKNLAFPQPWRRLSEFHWASVLSQYNISIGGRYIAVLPPLLIRHRVTPEMAAAVHNPAEKDSFLPPSRWNALAAALDPLDFTDFEIDDSIQLPHYHGQSNWGSNHLETELPYYPTSPMEIFLLTMLCFISALVIAYMMVVLYRCVCTRNYAEWRTSWTKDGQRASRNQPAMQIVMEAVPIVVAGHNQEVECLVTDGERIVSSCLQGSIRVWDFTNGEMITNINRNMFFELQNEVCNKLHYEKVIKNEDSKDGEAQGSSHFDVAHQKCFLPKDSDYNESILTDKPNRLWQSKFNFKKISNSDKPEDRRRCSSVSGKEKTIYDFALQYRKLHTYRMLYEDSTETNTPKTLKSENTLLIGDKVKSDDENINSENAIPCNVTVNNDYKVCNAKGETYNVNNISKSEDLFISNEVNSEVILKTECSDNLAHNKHLLLNSKEPLKQSNHKFPSSHLEANGDHQMADPLDDSIDFNFVSPPAIWCMDFTDDIIVIGCSNGRLEFWEASTGKLKCIFDDGYSGGVSHVRLTMLEELVLVAARLSGHLDLLQLHHPSNVTHKRTHVRTGSAGSISINNEHVYNRFAHKSPSTFSKKFNNVLYQEASTFSFENEGSTEGLCCMRLNMTRAHQQPISALECDGRRILTGSQDHTVKVFTINNLSQLYTLHGHCGPITCIFIDRFSPSVCGSGSQDGKLCVWDLLTGACVYSLQAHDGPISSLSYTASYVMSIGGDEKLCIWDRFRGHLLNAVNVGQGAGGCGLLSLTHSLVVTGGRGGLTVWDASTGMAVRKVHLGHNDGCIFVRQILPLKDSIVCDYANQLRIIRFPHVTKVDTNVATKSD